MNVRPILIAAALALSGSAALASPIYATTLVTSSNVTSFGSGLVTGAPDGGGLFLGSTFDPPALLGSLTVFFSTALGNGAGTDLEIIEIVSSPAETFNVEVSSDGAAFTLLGEFSATLNDIDFGSFGGPVSYVRLTNTSSSVSADIDALRGFYEFTGGGTTPAPATLALVGVALLGLGLSRRRG